MFVTPATFIAKLISAFQVLITLDMVLSTTMALPVTSKPIESTVENLAWQAWIELPPEQKQQVKSRKVTPKSIFTLPLRVECPDGHKQVDSKCIPIAIGTNDVLIDLNALGLLVGSTQPEDLYDYDDLGEEMANPMPFGSEMPVAETDKAGEGLKVELKTPSKDEPLKFNIFENKFNIFHEESLEDYSSISNEGVQNSEKQQNVTATYETSAATTNITAINDLFSEASNISENNFEFNAQPEKNSSTSDSHAEESNNFTSLADDVDFTIDAISVPAFSFETLKQNNLSVKEKESAIELVTTIMDTEATTTIEDKDKPPENDIQTLLQTESFLPLLNQTTATTLQDPAFAENISLTTVDLQETSDSSSDSLSRNVDEEITTLPVAMEQDMELKTKQEFTRSVNLHPTIRQSSYNVYDDGVNSGVNEQDKDSTLESLANDEPVETTAPMQVDETTIIETHLSLSTTTPSTTQEELKELLLLQEKAQKDFEELQRVRKGQKDQHAVLKKSKVQPVEVLATTTEITTTTTTAATTAVNMPTVTKQEDELKSSTAAEATTVTPLLTVHNENDNNDRFYYQHFGKQDNVVTQRSDNELKQKTATAVAEAEAETPIAVTDIGTTTTATMTEIETIPLTREIDLAEELRIINELVKGIRTATTTITTMQTTTTTTTTEKPTAYTSKTILNNDIQSMSSLNSHSESSAMTKKPTHTTSLIWSKIMPLLTTSSTTPLPTSATEENFNKITEKELNEPATASSARSNRNSKIIRFNHFNTNSAAKAIARVSSKTAATKTIFQDPTPSLEDTSSSSTTSSNQLTSSTEEVSTYEPYWWLPVAWRVNTPTSSERQQQEQEDTYAEQPLLLRLWSAYAPKSS